jgi:hypothetical protein
MRWTWFGSWRGAMRRAGTLRRLPGVDHFAIVDPQSAVWPIVLETVLASVPDPA